MKVFLTGGSGLLGSHIRHACSTKGVEVVAPTRQQLDLLDCRQVAQELARTQPQVVIHCAGLVGGIGDNIRRPYDYCFTNLQLGLSLVEAARQSGVSRLVNIASANVYPQDKDGELVSEQAMLSGALHKDTLGYGLAKGCVAKLVELCNKQFGLCYRNFIPSNLYGEWDDFTEDRAHMIPAIMRRLHVAAREQQQSVEIWGDGSARRAFLYAGDLAAFVVEKLNDLQNLPASLNLAPTKDYSVFDYNKMIAAVVGYQGEFWFNCDRPIGTAVTRLDTSAATRVGWNPQTSIDDGLARVYQYFLSNQSL